MGPWEQPRPVRVTLTAVTKCGTDERVQRSQVDRFNWQRNTTGKGSDGQLAEIKYFT